LPDALSNWAKNTKKATLCSIFSPEHGLLGVHEAGALVDSQNSSPWNCPIYSLHGQCRTPSPEMLSNLDTLIIDFQEVGVRCYTYLSTLQLTLSAAKENNVKILLLERPNPIKFWGSRGPVLERDYESFLGKIYTPFIHGKTIGQLAKDLNKSVGADLTVLTCDNVADSEESFLLNFTPPSPNLNSLDAVYAYPLTVFIEGTNYSEGRGTLYPFQQIGAPWVDAQVLAKKLNNKKLHGIYFEPVAFTPQNIPGMAKDPKHDKNSCNGVFLHVFDKKHVQPLSVAQIVLRELFMLYPNKSTWVKSGDRFMIDLLLGTDSLRRWVQANQAKVVTRHGGLSTHRCKI
jgi:uncharacterized protein YbbC (DUF1343 family)